MNYLLDTHTLIWAVTDPRQLSPSATELITDGRHDIVVSVVSFWEIALKHGLQKLTLAGLTPADFPQAALDTGFRLLELDAQTTATYYQLTATYHKDPFDRMLIWQALCQDYALISCDENVAKYTSEGLRVIW